MCTVHITYLVHSLWTPGHQRRLLHWRPSSGSPQISPRSPSVSSGGPQLDSIYSPDAPFYSTPPTSRSQSVEKNGVDKVRSCGSISHAALVTPLELLSIVISCQTGFKAAAVIIVRNISTLSIPDSHHISEMKNFKLNWAEIRQFRQAALRQTAAADEQQMPSKRSH